MIFSQTSLERTQHFTALLSPETALERQLLERPEFLEGLDWGVPRFGHPEGKVVFHIQEALGNIDALPERFAPFREKLRLIAFVHDAFKIYEDKSRPRDWSRHHGILARRFFEKFHADETVLDIIELHDEAYYCWRKCHVFLLPDEGMRSLERLLKRIDGFLQLYYLFFRVDTMTGDKNQAPLAWFERTVGGLDFPGPAR